VGTVPAVNTAAELLSRPQDRESAREIEARLSQIPSAVMEPGLAPAWLVHAMRELLGCDRFCAYRPSRRSDGWGLGERVTTDDSFFDRYDATLARTSSPFWYNPVRPERFQRDRVFVRKDVHRHGPGETCVVEEMWPRLGIWGHDQIRVLVCEGPMLLAWIGGYREEPFTRREMRLFSFLLPAVRRTLSLRRRLIDAGAHQAGLVHAMEAIGAAAFLADRGGRVVHANLAGESLLDERPRSTREQIRHEIAREGSDQSAARIDAPGMPERFLVVLRQAVDVDARLRTAAVRWGVTRREFDVLRGVVRGDSNKEIALRLALHEGSVERHVTSLLRKARCDGRSRLVARFWTL
jgi:DNA-binding NarL/FixJ family response regulator